MNKQVVTKVLDCVELKINLEKLLGEVLLDDVIGAALDKVVADTANPFDDAAKAMLWPVLEKEAKALIALKSKELEEAIAKKIAELKA